MLSTAMLKWSTRDAAARHDASILRASVGLPWWRWIAPSSPSATHAAAPFAMTSRPSSIARGHSPHSRSTNTMHVTQAVATSAPAPVSQRARAVSSVSSAVR